MAKSHIHTLIAHSESFVLDMFWRTVYTMYTARNMYKKNNITVFLVILKFSQFLINWGRYSTLEVNPENE